MAVNSIDLCTACQARLFNFDSFRKACSVHNSYFTSWKEVQEVNQNAPCAWCSMIYHEIQSTMQTLQDKNQSQFQGPPETIHELEKMIRNEKMEVSLCFRDEYNTSDAEKRNLLVITYSSADGTPLFMTTAPLSTPSDDPAASFIPDRPMICDMSSESTFRLARECLDECLHGKNDHKDCPKLVFTNIPTRVIDCEYPHNIRLKIDTQGVHEPYAALSYVWGGDQPERTTTGNIAQYVRKGLDMENTPQTIKDAIRVTHELGIRYLWIDSYCIIQNSPEDKANELPQMRRIYQNAYVTIIAAKAPKTNIGFLQDCPSFQSTFRVPFYCPNRELGSMTLSPRSWYNQYDAAEEPVNRRSWCLQERILAPRALVYASHTLQHLCQRGLKNIGGSFTPSKVNSVERLPRAFFNSGLHGSGTDNKIPTPQELRSIAMVWYHVVSDYTSRGLTVSSDKLNAISGVADEFQRILKCRYISGMWEHHLLGDLLWTRMDDPLPRPNEFRAPSWSWPSIEGMVGHPAGYVDPEEAYGFRILDWRIELVHPGFAFGEVRENSYLKVEGRLKRMMWKSGSNQLYDYTPSTHNDPEIPIGYAPVDSQNDAGEEGIIEEIWALPIILRVKKRLMSSRDSPKTLWGILIKKAAEEKGEKYKRVGSFRMALDENAEKGFEATPRCEIVLI